MRKIVLLCTFALLHVYLFSQNNTDRYSNSSYFEYSNKEKYKILYELTDESLLGNDSIILKSIDVSVFEHLQQPDADTTFTDENTGVSIVLYSQVKALRNGMHNRESNFNLIQSK